jgi:hypothetical protein
LTASGDNGVTQNNYAISSGWVSDLPGGGGSGGSIWLHCYRITGYGIILARGGNGTLGTYRYTTSSYQNSTFGSGGGAGGRIAMYFQKNDTFSEFRYLTIDLYFFKLENVCTSSKVMYTRLWKNPSSTSIFCNISPIDIFFSWYGGTIVVNMDLIREEIDLPFNCYVYFDGFLGLAPMTYVHGVEIHLAGVLANVVNITLHHGGYLWIDISMNRGTSMCGMSVSRVVTFSFCCNYTTSINCYISDIKGHVGSKCQSRKTYKYIWWWWPWW